MKAAKTNAADAGNQAFDEKDPDSPGPTARTFARRSLKRIPKSFQHLHLQPNAYSQQQHAKHG